MVLGLIIYWTAHKLSGNPVFYYLCGISLGVTASLIILVYFVSKLLPKVNYFFTYVLPRTVKRIYLCDLYLLIIKG